MKCYTVERTALSLDTAVAQETLHNTVFSTLDLAVEAMWKRADEDTNALSQRTFKPPMMIEVKNPSVTVKYEVKEHEFNDGKLG